MLYEVITNPDTVEVGLYIVQSGVRMEILGKCPIAVVHFVMSVHHVNCQQNGKYQFQIKRTKPNRKSYNFV